MTANYYLDGLKKDYASTADRLQAMDNDISKDTAAVEKSTLAKMIAGIEKPTAGKILLDGTDMTDLSITDRAKLGVSYAFQQPVRFKGITVLDLLRIASGKRLSVSEACAILSEVGLCARDYVNREVNGSLSGGELKRIEIATVLTRGTQLRETVEFLYSAGASEVHMRSACPPIMYPCRYLNFSRGNSPMDLLARRMVQQLEGNEGQKHLEEYADSSCERGKCLLHAICEQFGFDSLSYQSLEGMLEAIGIDREQVCTYCWTGKE